MRKQLLMVATAGALAVSMTACGGSKPAETTAAATTAAATTAAAAETEAAEEDAEASIVEVPVTIINGTGVELQTLEMSASGLEEWGEDLLGEFTMPHGTYADLVMNVDADNLEWDLRVTDSEGTALEWYNIDISEMPSEGFGIELLWDGSEGTANVIADPSQMEGDYVPAEEAAAEEEVAEEDAEAEGEIQVADASAALAGSAWVDNDDNIYEFDADEETLYLTLADGTELVGTYLIAAGDNGVVAMVMDVPDAGLTISSVLTGISESALEFTDVESGEPAVFTPVE